MHAHALKNSAFAASPCGAPFWLRDKGPSLPTFPAGYVALYNPFDITKINLVTGSSIDLIEDRETATPYNLTQSTSADQAALIEHDTATQYTASSQPKLDYDKIVTQDTLVNEPKLIDTGGGVLAVGFGSTEILDNYPSPENLSSVSIEIDIKHYSVGGAQRYIYGSVGNDFVRIKDATRYEGRVNSVSSGTLATSGVNPLDRNRVKFTFTGTDIELHINEVFQSSQPLIGTPQLDFISRIPNEYIDGEIYSIKQWNSADSTDTPDFELLPDPTTMRKDDGSEPSVGDQISGWKATGAELAVEFDGTTKILSGIPIQPSEFSILLDLNLNASGSNQKVTRGDQSTQIQVDTDGRMRVFFDSGFSWRFVSTYTFGLRETVLVTVTNTLAKISINGGAYEEYILNGEVPRKSNIIGNHVNQWLDGNIYSYKQYNSAIVDPANITETPDFELLPTVETIPSGIGNPVPKWYATSHKDFLNLFDFGSDDFYNDFPVLANDATYIVNNFTFKALGTQKLFLSCSSTSASFGTNAADQFEAIADDASVFAFALSAVDLNENTAALKHEGDNLSLYLNGVLIESLDVTGKAFSFDQVGAPVNSANATLAEIVPYPSALSLERIQYFSWARNENNKITLPLTLA